jgi:hypothetical protein
MERAVIAGVDKTQVQMAGDLLSRCQIEYWLSVMLDRLKSVITADDSNEHDMNKLRAAIQKAQALNASEQLIEEALKFLQRLDAELGMSRAIKALPVVKLPPPGVIGPDNPLPEGYWAPREIGHIEETEGYPLPPADNNGEYKWIHAEAYTALGLAIDLLKASYNGAEALGANPDIIKESKDRLLKAEKEYKILDSKENSDKLLATEVVKKLAKKLKKGSGKKK